MDAVKGRKKNAKESLMSFLLALLKLFDILLLSTAKGYWEANTD